MIGRRLVQGERWPAQGYVMLPWMFNLFTDEVTREVNAGVWIEGQVCSLSEVGWPRRRVGYCLQRARRCDGRFKRETTELCFRVGRLCERRKLRVTVNKSKHVRFSCRKRQVSWSVNISAQNLQEIEFEILGCRHGSEGNHGS